MAKKDAKDRDGKTVRRKIIPEDVGDSEQLILDVYSSVGLGKLNIYECNQILVDPDRRDDKLQDYEYEPDLLVVLSVVEAYSFRNKWGLPDFDKKMLPSPGFKINVKASNPSELVYSQQALQYDVVKE